MAKKQTTAAAENAAADKENKAAATSKTEVTNATESPSFSKEKQDGEDDRVSQLGPEGQAGASAQTKDADVAAREQRLDAREAELAEREAKLAAREAALEDKPAKKEKSKGHQFSFEGSKYQFKDGTPETIRVDGRALSQKDIAKDDDLLLQLIGGGSGLITKINE